LILLQRNLAWHHIDASFSQTLRANAEAALLYDRCQRIQVDVVLKPINPLSEKIVEDLGDKDTKAVEKGALRRNELLFN
jgi:hypothetical protein